jgi:hypothetical protein
MSKNKDNLLTCFKNVVFAGLSGVLCLIVCYFVIGAALEHDGFMARNIAVFIVMAVFNAGMLYKLHFSNHIYTYAEHGDKFDVMSELKAYIRAEGKYFLLIYGLCALASEIDMLIPRATVGGPVMMVCSFALNPCWGYIPIPVLRYVLACLYSFGVICVMAIIRSRKVYKQERKIRNQHQ